MNTPTKLTETAETVLARRYYLKDGNGNVLENWESLCRRVADAVAAVDSEMEDYEILRQDFFDMIHGLDFLPNSPCLMNAGTDLGQLSACFVLPVEDSMDGIFTSIRNGALVHKTGGGTGYSFSRLRPKNSAVRSTQGVASGPLSFAAVFDAATETIKQGGKRRGANMGVLRVDHPDIIDFISAKEDQNKFTNFNFSVAVTDTFMEAVKNRQEYDLIDPSNKKVVNTLNAAKVFDKIIDLAWHNGEPGVLFIDAANRGNAAPQLGEFEATNPCWSGDTEVLTIFGFRKFKDLAKTGKSVWVPSIDDAGRLCVKKMHNPRMTDEAETLYSFATSDGYLDCTSGHNLFRFGPAPFEKVKAGHLEIGDRVTGYNRLFRRKPIEIICRGAYVDPQRVYNGTVEGTHRYFVRCGSSLVLSANCGEQWLLPYESCNLGSINLGRYVHEGKVDFERLGNCVKTAVRFLDNVIDCNRFPIPEIAEMTRKTRKIGLGIMGLHDMLIQLRLPYGEEKGRKASAEVMRFIREQAEAASIELAELKGAFPAYDPKVNNYSARRNAALTSIQPTGTVSMIADCASGCEPYFSVVMEKNVMDGDRFLMVNKHFEAVARKEGFFSEPLMQKVARTGTVIGHDEIPEEWGNIFRTAQDITPEEHIRMQGALQVNGVDSSISKTINLPASATKDDVRLSYMLGYELGCKGLTVYRDGSRDAQVLNTVGTESKQTAVVSSRGILRKTELPDVLSAKRYRLKDANSNTIYIIVCFAENETPMEVFAKFPFDNRVDLKDKSTMWTTTCRLVSIALRYKIPMEEIIKQLDRSSGHMFDLPAQLSKLLKSFMAGTRNGFSSSCPECPGTLVFEEGCEVCRECGYSKCS